MTHIRQPNLCEIKRPKDIEAIAHSGHILADVLTALQPLVAAGRRVTDIDSLAAHLIAKEGASATFLGYEGYPASICISLDDVVVHGIPGRGNILPGSLVSVDVGVTFEGWVADAAYTWGIAPVSLDVKRLLDGTRRALVAGIAQCQVGRRVGDISHAIESVLQEFELGVVRDIVGHGVGRHLHEEPSVPNYGKIGRGPRLMEGMVLAIEPMATLGSGAVYLDADGWTLRTQDKSLAAHFEHTVAVTREGPRILTPWHDFLL